jgi:hypothetical protein
VDAGKVVSTVCHGAELFKSAVDSQGVPLVKGKVRNVAINFIPGCKHDRAWCFR